VGVMVLPPGVYVVLKIVAAQADRVWYSQLAAELVIGFAFSNRPDWYARSAEAEDGQSQ
jgi:hypothetical protein